MQFYPGRSSCRYRKIDVLRQRFVRAGFAAGPVQLDVAGARLVKHRLAIAGSGMRPKRESIVKAMLTIQIPLQANRSGLPTGIDIEDNIDRRVYLKTGGRHSRL